MTERKAGVKIKLFRYQRTEFHAWIDAHARWRAGGDADVWGRFAPQAQCGRYTFSSRNQPHRHFAETLVGHCLEQRGYICWTNVRLFRTPERQLRGTQAIQTRLVEDFLRHSLGVVPQVEYERHYVDAGLRLKNIDLVGFDCRKNHWIFAEVKKDRDRLHPEQEGALLFLRALVPLRRADVFVASVQPT
jgi:hypothetical protein